MIEIGKKYKLKAGPKLPEDTFVGLAGAGCKYTVKLKDPATGKMVELPMEAHRIPVAGPDGRLVNEIEVDEILYPERLQAAVDRGHLIVVTSK